MVSGFPKPPPGHQRKSAVDSISSHPFLVVCLLVEGWATALASLPQENFWRDPRRRKALRVEPHDDSYCIQPRRQPRLGVRRGRSSEMHQLGADRAKDPQQMVKATWHFMMPSLAMLCRESGSSSRRSWVST